MTIDEAIKYADMMALDVLPLDDMPEICAFGELCAAALRLSKNMGGEGAKLDELFETVREVWKVAPVCDTCHKDIAVYRWEEVNDDLEEVTYQECTACHKKRIQKMMEKFVN